MRIIHTVLVRLVLEPTPFYTGSTGKYYYCTDATLEEHLQNRMAVLQRLNNYGSTLTEKNVGHY